MSFAAFSNALEQVGLRSFGLSMPFLSPSWTDSTTPTVNDGAMSLSLAAGSWHAPAFGAVQVSANSGLDQTLLSPTGAASTGPGVLLTLYPQSYLRLKRLYAMVLEDTAGARPERTQGLPFRPVPKYFYYAGAPGTARGGGVAPGDALETRGDLTIYDETGLPIDPLAVASAFFAFMNEHNILQHRGLGTTFNANPQVRTVAQLATPSVVRVRLSESSGAPYDGSNLSGLTSVNAASGLFSLDASGGAGSNLTGSITKNAATGATGTFPNEVHRLLKFGPSTTGRLRGGAMAFPGLPTTVTLQRDFFSVRVLTLGRYLRGVPDPAFDGTKVENPPSVRIHEPLNLHSDGNDVLARAQQALTGATIEQLAVAQAIDGSFSVANQSGANAHWPQFPAAAGTADPAGALPIGLREGFNPTAHFFDDGDAGSANVDVILALAGLPPDAAVRVYHRRFVEDAKEARGAGAGGVAAADGTLVVHLRDPFELRVPGTAESSITIPTDATLRFDVAIVKRTAESRIYGNVSCSVDAATTESAPGGGSNLYGTATRRGVSNAGILGLGSFSGTLPTDVFDVILALTGEANPRDASRFPTMARRDLIVAGLAAATGGQWQSVLGAGRLDAELHSADSRLGAPGGRGGRETQAAGVSSQNGRIAYDMARMGLRRTSNIVSRIEALADDRWNEPPQPAELAVNAAPGVNQGTFAAAVLQTIAPKCETPELFALSGQVEPDSTTRPSTFDELVDWVADNLVPDSIPLRSQIINLLNTLKDGSTLNESDKERLFNEVEREIMSCIYGRRDSQWALLEAIGNARRFIYIESPAFGLTRKEYEGPVPAYAKDLIEALNSRIAAAPGLRVMICTPKHPDFAAGYEPMAARAVKERYDKTLGLTTANLPDANASRVLGFHPVGFPGRSSRLESSVVIVDDVWALTGSGAFNRRGLTFDGSSDLVLTDTDLVDGVSPRIAQFRRALMTDRLGLAGHQNSGTVGAVIDADPATSTLRDGVEAFYTIRQMLVAGGLGKIERLWNGHTVGLTPIDPDSVTLDVTSPEGHEVNMAELVALSAIGALGAW